MNHTPHPTISHSLQSAGACIPDATPRDMAMVRSQSLDGFEIISWLINTADHR